MEYLPATAAASPNIALIKYWGNRDATLRIPSNDSLSLTLDSLVTKTTVHFTSELRQDVIRVNDTPADQQTEARISNFLDYIRPDSRFAEVTSENNFPSGVGAASSASGFAALAMAASSAAGLNLSKRELTVLARKGSGSAARSIIGGVVQLHAGRSSDSSFAEQILPSEHWPLTDLIAIVNRVHKSIGSTAGHELAATSPLQQARVAHTPTRLQQAISALESRDFSSLADVCELDSNLMHAVMNTSTPTLLYWEPATVSLMQSIRRWRAEGLPVFYTIDAGPNVHCITLPSEAFRIRALLTELPGVEEVLQSGVGNGVRLLP